MSYRYLGNKTKLISTLLPFIQKYTKKGKQYVTASDTWEAFTKSLLSVLETLGLFYNYLFFQIFGSDQQEQKARNKTKVLKRLKKSTEITTLPATNWLFKSCLLKGGTFDAIAGILFSCFSRLMIVL